MARRSGPIFGKLPDLVTAPERARPEPERERVQPGRAPLRQVREPPDRRGQQAPSRQEREFQASPEQQALLHQAPVW
jgi:hypothetical protein